MHDVVHILTIANLVVEAIVQLVNSEGQERTGAYLCVIHRETHKLVLHALIGDGSGAFLHVRDGKTGKRARTEQDVRNSTELGFYAIAAQQETGVWPVSVGYFVWIRKGTPEWQDAMSASTAYKVVANSFYGAGGSAKSRYNDRDVSEATASWSTST